MPKATKAQAEERLNTVYNMLVVCCSRKDILQYAAKHEWELNARQIDTYIARANKKIIEAGKVHRETELPKVIALYRFLMQATIKVQDFGRTATLLRDYSHLLGLPEPTKSELNLKLTADSEILLTRLLAELEAANIPASDAFTALLNRLAEANKP